MLFRSAFWCCVLAVLLLSLGPQATQAEIPGGDKWQHVAAFLMMGCLAGLGWPGRVMNALGFLFLYGCAIELAQSFTPDRQADWTDVVTNAAGLAAAWLLLQAVRVGRRSRAR